MKPASSAQRHALRFQLLLDGGAQRIAQLLCEDIKSRSIERVRSCGLQSETYLRAALEALAVIGAVTAIEVRVN